MFTLILTALIWKRKIRDEGLCVAMLVFAMIFDLISLSLTPLLLEALRM